MEFIQKLKQFIFHKNTKILVSILIIYYIIVNTDFSKFSDLQFSDIILFIVMSLIISALHEAIRVIKTKLILEHDQISVKNLLKINIISYFFILPTPGGVGDVSRSYFWFEAGGKSHSLKYYSLLFVFDRLSSLVVLGLISFFPLTFYLPFLSSIHTYRGFIFPFILIFAFVFMIVFYRYILSIHNIQITSYVVPKVFMIFVIDFILLILISSQILVIFYTFNLKLVLWDIIISMAIANLIAIIPISFGGLGLREYSLGYILSLRYESIGHYFISSILFFSISLNQLILALNGMVLNNIRKN